MSIDVDKLLAENPRLATTVMRFMVLHDAADVLTEIRAPECESVVIYLQETAKRLVIAHGLPEGFAQAMADARPPLDVTRLGREVGG